MGDSLDLGANISIDFRGVSLEKTIEENFDAIDTSFKLPGLAGNGADTILIFGILFADSTPAADALIMSTLAAMAIIFVLVAMYVVRHPTISSVISRYAHRVLPFVLIIVGAYVLANTMTDALPN
jgi:cadmium resistance protein CadD (predicted permease)